MSATKRTCGRHWAMIVALLAGLSLTGIAAWACIDGASPTEVTWASNWGGPCRQDIIDSIWSKWDLTDDSWGPVGLRDDCNENLPFFKVINAVVLISNGPHYELGGFHDAVDYNDESRSTSSPYHGNFYLRFISQEGAVEANSQVGRSFGEDRTNIFCGTFDVNSGADTLAERAGTLVHEAWHHWQQAHNYPTKHQNGPTGACNQSGPACDTYYFHPPDFKLPDGTLSSQIGNLNKTVIQNNVGIFFHSAYQIQVEFDADIALFANTDYVPSSVQQQAQAIGNARLAQNFVNVVPFSIGSPAPFPTYTPRQNP